MTEIQQLKKYCMECGSETDADADFCYICGSRKIISVNPSNNRVIMEKGHCPYCGNDNVPDASFCAKCGRRIGEFEYGGVRKTKLSGKDILAIFLALIPGAFNVFGLGHLAMKKVSRGLMYLAISAVLLYLRFANGDVSYSMLIILEVIGLLVYLKQASEIFREAYTGY
ncbi:MAG: zinc ribbon domain-containing protein [archaeon]|nr:zinc ribbon domain-containing protein [archaeon]